MGRGGQGIGRDGELSIRHCEKRSDEAIQSGLNCVALDCFASLAMTCTVGHTARDKLQLGVGAKAL